jgi:hypothetical protein
MRGKVKEDEIGIAIAGARSLSSEPGEGGGVAKQIGRILNHESSRQNKYDRRRQETTRQRPPLPIFDLSLLAILKRSERTHGTQSAPQFLREKAGHQNLFFPARLAADDLDSRQRDLQTLAEKSPQPIVGFAIHRGRIQPDLQRISVDSHDLVACGARSYPDRQQQAFFRFSQEHHVTVRDPRTKRKFKKTLRAPRNKEGQVKGQVR